MASAGYPNAYPKGEIISGLGHDSLDHHKIFHAGTVERDGKILTNGGRVLCATALGDSVTEAQGYAYDLANCVRWDNLYIRTDIAYKAIARENTQDD